jgi:hypothetical protein
MESSFLLTIEKDEDGQVESMDINNKHIDGLVIIDQQGCGIMSIHHIRISILFSLKFQKFPILSFSQMLSKK